MEILFLFLPAIIFLGLITSYEDIKFGKIRNKYIILGIAVSLFLYFFIIMYNIVKGEPVEYSYFLFLGANILISFLLAVILWLSRIWTAADAKLFTVFTILLPLSIYQYSTNKFFPSIFLLINCFVPYFFYLSFKGLFFTTGKNKIKALKSIKLTEIVEMIFALFVISWIARLFIGDILLRFALIAILYIIFEKFTKAKITTKIAILGLFGIARIFIDVETLTTSNFWKTFLLFVSLFMIFRFFITNLVRRAIIQNMPIKKLEPGMVLAEIIERRKNKYVKSANISRSFIELSSEGLTKKDIEKIGKTGIKNIKVIETICFAPFIFLGAIITIIARGNLFNLFFDKPSYLLPITSNLIAMGIIFISYINTKKYKKEIAALKLKR